MLSAIWNPISAWVNLNMVHGTKGYQIWQYFYLYWKVKKHSVFVSVDKDDA